MAKDKQMHKRNIISFSYVHPKKKLQSAHRNWLRKCVCVLMAVTAVVKPWPPERQREREREKRGRGVQLTLLIK